MMNGIQLPKPCCEGMSRKEITDLLNQELVTKRLTKRNAYTYWAHEVPIYDKNTELRIDFMLFTPYSHGFNLSAAGVERGIFECFEIKSSLADLKSGHGLNFYGDRNWIVCPVEVYLQYEKKRFDDDTLRNLIPYDARFLVYGKARNGRPVFVEAIEDWRRESLWKCVYRKRSAAELLFCMMRALVANSDHSNVDHKIEGVFVK